MGMKAKTDEMSHDFTHAFTGGAEAWKDGFEKATQGMGQFVTFNRQGVEAAIRAANAAVKGIEQVNGEVMAFSRQAMEDQSAVMQAVMSSKSVQDAVETQSQYAKSAMDAFLGQMTKINEIVMRTAREAVEPINESVKSFVETMQTAKPRA